MRFADIRKILFQLHMWIGLLLGILFALLGLSGSAIVYDREIADFLDPPPRAMATGSPLSLDRIADAARAAAGGGPIQIALPENAGEAIVVRAGAARGDGPGRSMQLFIDPVSGALLETRMAALPPFLAFAHQLHGNFLMGRAGRRLVVGWLGVAMLILGATGLVLWWPRRGQWKYAFLVRRKAEGLRFHRELHAATGIWVFAIFMAVSFSGVVLAWPQTMGANGGANAPGIAAAPRVEPVEGIEPLGAGAALALAERALPEAVPRSISLPSRRDQPIGVAFLSHGAVPATVLVDAYRAKVISLRDPSHGFMGWQRPVHQGTLNPVWRFLVFLVGFVPALFVTTGVIMWWKKYRRHIPMNAPLAEESWV